MGKRKEITQDERVLRHLNDFGSITSWQAIEEYGITRLSACIYRLRRDGYEINNELKFSKNRYGEPVHFVKYKINKEKKRNPLAFESLLKFFGMPPLK